MNNLLDEARKIISKTDEEIAKLFVKRMRAVESVASYKKDNGLPIYDKQREEELIRKNSQLIEDSVLREYYVRIQEKTMEVSRAYQTRLLEGMKIAYCGTEGAYAHIAACKLFPTAKKLGYSSFDDAYKTVVDGECDVCILPLENSIGGEVGQVSDLLFFGPLYINEVIELPISHDLLGVNGTTIADVKSVISHPQALSQCRAYIREHGFNEIEYSNTALSAEYVKERGDKSIAAIASAEAAEIFGLEVIDKNINMTRSNTTRFAVLSRSENRQANKAKGIHTVLLFTVKNEAGSLAKAVEIIGKHGFNMRSLRSRPMRELLWQYYFYIEIEGSLDTDKGKLMFEELSELCDRLKSCGTYKNLTE